MRRRRAFRKRSRVKPWLCFAACLAAVWFLLVWADARLRPQLHALAAMQAMAGEEHALNNAVLSVIESERYASLVTVLQNDGGSVTSVRTDAVGINVTSSKYIATCVGGGISGFGGLYYVMNYIKGTWENSGTIEGLGWLAVALVIFATWKPLRSIWGSYLFGVLYWMFFYISGLTRSSQELFKMLPYLVTLLVLIVVSLRKKREDQPPMSLGLPYFREER